MMTELTDKELDAVSGGSTITLSDITQANALSQTATATAVNAVTLGSLAAATVVQGAVQSNNFS